MLGLAGDKTRAREAARAAGVPVLEGSGAGHRRRRRARRAASALGFPLFVKAAMGGGGRGMRLVRSAEELEAALAGAIREAEAAFGDGTVYLEQAMLRARHIEVQLLADAAGGDRAPVRARLLGPAPPPEGDRGDAGAEPRRRRCASGSARPRSPSGARSATSTPARSSSCVGPDGASRFIEMNPRIQVEHTVTEETTEVDLVRAQILIAGGATLAELGLEQEEIRQRGVALQCRVTTENPSNGFRPDAGRITAYRSPGGAGIRLDEGSAFVGAEVSPYFDPLLVKMTARGPTLRSAAARARRAVAELRVRGVSTNQSFLRALLRAPRRSSTAQTHTGFVDEHPDLVAADPGADRASRLLARLADVTVNREREPPAALADPRAKLPAAADGAAAAGVATAPARARPGRVRGGAAGPDSRSR